MSQTAGAAIRVVMTKWGDRPHWEFDAAFLGSDRHGDWLGIPAGTHMSRPGKTYVAPVDQVGLVPPAGPDADRGWLATFHAEGGEVQVYVDITGPPVWDGRVLRTVDLDLDVVRGNDGRVWVEDEDEFADHQVRFGYPDEVITEARASCERVRAAVESATAPYDGSAAAWFTRLTGLGARPTVER